MKMGWQASGCCRIGCVSIRHAPLLARFRRPILITTKGMLFCLQYTRLALWDPMRIILTLPSTRSIVFCG